MTGEIAAINVLGSTGWLGPSRIVLSDEGRILEIRAGIAESAGAIRGPIIPGMPNLHSHAFQRQMAGLTEGAPGHADSFWTWRNAMYRLAQRITPSQLQAIAAWLQLEMLEAGYTSCAEFHYVHHQPDGRPYDDIAEMSARLLAAAEHSGMALTLLPVLYCRSGFDATDVNEGQIRFRNKPEQFLRLHEACANLVADRPLHRLGVAPHSLRAVSLSEMNEITAQQQVQGCPIHIHIAEQQREVEDCREILGTTPVAWLLEHQDVAANWCLVHATHIEQAELLSAARTGAVAGLCPTTEAELGDGSFRADDWLAAGGRFGVGSDSNLRVSATEELRLLEFQCRLRLMRRNVLAQEGLSCGRSLHQQAARGGALALQQPVGVIEPGRRADLVELDATHPLLEGRTDDELLDTWVFAGGRDMVRTTWVGGKVQVENGRHVRRVELLKEFRSAMKELRP